LLVACAAAMWGTWSLILRPMGLPATLTSSLVMLMVGAWALPAVRFAGPARWDRVTLALLAANTVFDALNVVTFFGAIERTSVAIAVLTHYAAPVIVAVAAPRIDGVTIRGAPIAAVVATLGLALVLEPWRGAGDGALIGGALGLTSAVAYAGNVFIVGRLARRIGASRAIAYHSLAAGALLLPLAAPHLDLVTGAQLAELAIASLVLGSVAGVMFVTGLALVGSARAAVLAFLEPLVAVICGWAAFGEALGLAAGAGGALVLGAGMWVARSR